MDIPKKITCLFVLFCLFFLQLLHGQDKIDSAMATLSEKYPQEKIYLAYDRSEYVVGETIWFKAFVFSGYSISTISTNLYVELCNSNKEVLSKKMLPLINGVTEGSFAIPDTTREAVYYIRAYTSWMLNFEEAFQYIHPLLIFNPSSKLKLQKQDLPWRAAVFPEGGNILNSQQTTMSVRLYSDGDLPQHWHGYLFDSVRPNEKLISFESIDPNVARFSFPPNLNVNYLAIIEDDKGNKSTIPLPKVKSSGVNLSLNRNDSVLEYKIDFLNIPQQETFQLVGTIDNTIVYKARIKNEGSSIKHSFVSSQMPKGVLRLTLFDKMYQVVSERLCFLSPFSQHSSMVDSIKVNHQPRRNNEIILKIDSGSTVSAMVFDETAANPFAKNNLLSSIWLNADFKNQIHYAENYFSKEDNFKSLDAVLVSNTWERFNWQDVLSQKFPALRNERDYYKSYIGTVYYKKKLLQNEAINLILFLPDSSKQLYQAKTDVHGKILLEGLLFEGAAKVIIQQSNKKINSDLITIDFSSTEKFEKYQGSFPVTNYSLTANKELVSNPGEREKYIERIKYNAIFSEKLHQLEEVTVYAKAKSLTAQLDQKLSSGRFFNPRETIYDFINVVQPGSEGGIDPHTWLKSRIPGYDILYEKAGIITYYIEETIVDKTNLFLIDNLPFDNIAMIKIQGKGKGHQVFIYLKHGGEMVNRGKTLPIEKLLGYEHQEIYPLPDYSKQESSKIKNDKRDVLFWSNLISSDLPNQKFKINFYNNDTAKKFRLIILKSSEEDGPVFVEKIIE